MPLKRVINEICQYQSIQKLPTIYNFDQFYDLIETDLFSKIHFTNSGQQFYQEKLTASDGNKAVIFANIESIEQLSDSTIMYVDSSYKIETKEGFNYQLITTLLWVEESVSMNVQNYSLFIIDVCLQYYPIMFALINKKSQEIFKMIFNYLRDVLAPILRPTEVVTDYEAQLYYALGETYSDAHIGGAIFYYAQNMYKKLCALNLSKNLETNSLFRNIYHMLLMLPLLPVNTIEDALINIEIQAKEMELNELTETLFEYIKTQWISTVTPELFCVHQLENRINENIIAPFKKLRDLLLTSKGKSQRNSLTVLHVVEKLKELEAFLKDVYSKQDKKPFARDLSSSQKKNVLRAWVYIESHPKINVNVFFSKVLGYIKCMENQLWIWGFYRYSGPADDTLINVNNFSLIANDDSEEIIHENQMDEHENQLEEPENLSNPDLETVNDIVMEGVINEHGSIILETNNREIGQEEASFLKYAYE